jgi:hypothetical protein
MTLTTYDVMAREGGVPVKMWTRGVPVEDEARDQLSRAAQMPLSSNMWRRCPMCMWGSVPRWDR